jgi:hypothetical protein
MHNQFVIMMNAIILDPGTAEAVSTVQKNSRDSEVS